MDESPRQRGQVLLIEDDAELRWILSMVLQAERIKVHAVQSFGLALAFLHKEVASVVVADVVHEGEQQWDSLEKVVKAAKPAPTVLATAALVDTKTALNAGCSRVLRKPFSMESLLAAVAESTFGEVKDEAVLKVARDYFKALERRDWELLASLCAEDVRYHVPGDDPLYSKQLHGRDAFVRYAEEVFSEFKDVKFDIKAISALQDASVARYVSTWKGGPPAMEGAVLFRLKDGKIGDVGVRLDLRRVNAH